MKRRTFINNVSLLSASLFSLPAWAGTKAGSRLGLQLYTLKDIIGNNLKNVFSEINKMGFKVIETFDYNAKNHFFGYTTRDFASLLNDYGLAVPSNHLGVNLLFKTGSTEEVERFIEHSAYLKSNYITIPNIDFQYRKSADDYKRHAETFNKAGELCNKAGMRLAYHNHEFEFKKFGNLTGLDILITETDAKLIDFELDIYWAARSNVDPLELLRKYKGRFPLWHVKDMSKQNKDWNTEIGKGTINFPSILTEANKLGLKHAFIEQETNYTPNPIGSAQASFNYVNKFL